MRTVAAIFLGVLAWLAYLIWKAPLMPDDYDDDSYKYGYGRMPHKAHSHTEENL